jgi:hypothetical protein
MQLITERVVGGHVSGISSIPVINSKSQRCLTYIKRSPAVLEVHKRNEESSNSINIFHRNIRVSEAKVMN